MPYAMPYDITDVRIIVGKLKLEFKPQVRPTLPNTREVKEVILSGPFKLSITMTIKICELISEPFTCSVPF